MEGTNYTWLQVDLEFAFRITQIKLFNYVDGRYYHYYLQGSMDGENWYPIAVKMNNNPATTSGDTHITEATARYVRVTVTKNSANNVAHINEVQVYGYPVNAVHLPEITVEQALLNEGSYMASDQVRLSYSLRNDSNESVELKNVKAHIFGLGHASAWVKQPLSATVNLLPNQTYQETNRLLWTIPANTPPGAYGVYLEYDLGDGVILNRYETFFRIVTASQRTVYHIDWINYNGLDVFALDGGMSAESAVQKSAEMLSAGVSHSWYMNGEGGPNPVFSTPAFLERSVEQTVDFYNTHFGATTKFDTVIISTGNTAVPYLSHLTEAPVLPVQFLASIDTIKELQEILEHANSNGLPSFGTAGYARSVPMIGVAWVKMLGLPQAYIDFIEDHQVENIIIMARMGTTGESTAKKVLFEGVSQVGTAPGDIFAMYKQDGNASDIAWMNRRLKDIGEVPLESGYRNVSDWESGMIVEQVDGIVDDLENRTQVSSILVISGEGSDNLYDFATYATLAYFKKNETVLAPYGAPVRGVALNPYQIDHPFYETKINYVPFLYWQGKSTDINMDVRLNQTVRDAIAEYYPSIVFEDLKFWINSSRNFGGPQAADVTMRLQSLGLTNLEFNNYNSDEEWNPADGMNAPVEQVANRMINYSTVQELKDLRADLMPLDFNDLLAIPAKYPDISVYMP